MIRRPPRSTLFPSTPLFRSDRLQHHPEHAEDDGVQQRLAEPAGGVVPDGAEDDQDRKSTRLNSSHANISYAVFCLKKKSRPLYVPSPCGRALHGWPCRAHHL